MSSTLEHISVGVKQVQGQPPTQHQHAANIQGGRNCLMKRMAEGLKTIHSGHGHKSTKPKVLLTHRVRRIRVGNKISETRNTHQQVFQFTLE